MGQLQTRAEAGSRRDNSDRCAEVGVPPLYEWCVPPFSTSSTKTRGLPTRVSRMSDTGRPGFAEPQVL